ncbi:DUF6623 family protein [Bacillus kandeliae]|uniref:DUF6623 family protein n=1 Tax=Bacillus kandeliae TaxID=3129297 RepID=UPI0039B77199
MALTAMWTHGNAVVPETPELLDRFTRLGFGTQVTLRRGTNQWFHVPMPSPVLLGGVRPKLRRIFILGNSDVSSCIRRVHIFDGSTRVRDVPKLICGNKLAIGPDNTIEFGYSGQPGLPIYYGLGITMFIESATFSASYFFAAFGADWE